MEKRIEQLQNILNSQEPYRQWACKEHNTCGSGGTNRFCCDEELELLINKKPSELKRGKMKNEKVIKSYEKTQT